MKCLTENCERLPEEWKPVVGFPGYEISSYGRVKGKKGQIMTPTRQKSRKHYYWHVDLMSPFRNHNCKKLHRMVAEAFIPNPDNLPEVNHKDCNRDNNTIGNLEWASRKSNMEHASHNGRLLQGSKHRSAKFTEKQVIELREFKKNNPKVSSNSMAKMHGVNSGTMSRLLSNKQWRHL